MGRIIPCIMENKKCLKPPTSHCFISPSKKFHILRDVLMVSIPLLGGAVPQVIGGVSQLLGFNTSNPRSTLLCWRLPSRGRTSIDTIPSHGTFSHVTFDFRWSLRHWSVATNVWADPWLWYCHHHLADCPMWQSCHLQRTTCGHCTICSYFGWIQKADHRGQQAILLHNGHEWQRHVQSQWLQNLIYPQRFTPGFFRFHSECGHLTLAMFATNNLQFDLNYESMRKDAGERLLNLQKPFIVNQLIRGQGGTSDLPQTTACSWLEFPI